MTICNGGICIRTQFILVKNIQESIIIGIPFLTTIFSFTVNLWGITTRIFEKYIFYKFIFLPKEKEVKLTKEKSISKLVNRKKSHINCLNKKVRIMNIEEQLKNENLKRKIESLEKTRNLLELS